MSVEERERIDRKVEGFFWVLMLFAVVYVLLQVVCAYATGGTIAPSDTTPPTSFPVHIVHMPTTDPIRIKHHG